MRTLLVRSCFLALLSATLASCAANGTKPVTAVAGQNSGCARETGTRILLDKEERCSSSPGHGFSGDELRRTGQGDTASALKRLDPAVH